MRVYSRVVVLASRLGHFLHHLAYSPASLIEAMRIAQIAPLIESVPPRLYGGTERVVHTLTEELVRLGHDVTLFASGDSRTSASLIAGAPRALRLDAEVVDVLPHFILQLEQVRARARQFDILHFHTDLLHYPLVRCLQQPAVTTHHGRLDLPDLIPCYHEFADLPRVSISDYQRRPWPHANWIATVYHGLASPPVAADVASGGDYLAFLGRISPEKRPDRAIEIARRAGLPLKMVAKVDQADLRYYEERIAPLIDGECAEYLGEMGEEEKLTFLGNARALVFPIDWPEPFGLVMIEAMACGTPVIAWRRGSVPEIIDEGVTGFIVDSVDEAVAAVARVAMLDRALVRLRFEERFSAQRMARDYLAAYRTLLGTARPFSALSLGQA